MTREVFIQLSCRENRGDDNTWKRQVEHVRASKREQLDGCKPAQAKIGYQVGTSLSASYITQAMVRAASSFVNLQATIQAEWFVSINYGALWARLLLQDPYFISSFVRLIKYLHFLFLVKNYE
jgi:hypothetical protein